MKGKLKLKASKEVVEETTIDLNELTKKQLLELYPEAEGTTKKEIIQYIEDELL